MLQSVQRIVNTCQLLLFTKRNLMSERKKNTEIISNNIKYLRSNAEWTQADLAKKSGVSPAAISLIEKGERIPSLVVTRKLASAFKVSEAEITGATSEKPTEINTQAHAFFRDFGDIEELHETDKEIIRDLVTRLKDRTNDKGGK